MTLEEKLAAIVDATKELKTTKVAARPDDPDLLIYMHFYRDDFIPMVVQCQQDRDIALETLWIGSSGFSATEVALTCEAYHAVTENSPITGEPWQHHELQYVCETMPGNGSVWECLTTLIVDRDLRVLTNMSCYQITDGVVEWVKDLLLDELETKVHGRAMVETLRDAMKRPLLMDIVPIKADPIAQAFMGQLGEVATEFHCDMAVWKTLIQKNLIVDAMMGATPGTERYDLMKERLGEPDLGPHA